MKNPSSPRRSPRDVPIEGWTTPRVFLGIFGALPAGVVVGLLFAGFACYLTSALRSATVLFTAALLVAIWFTTLAWRTKVVARLFFLSATVGSLMICLIIGICGR